MRRAPAVVPAGMRKKNSIALELCDAGTDLGSLGGVAGVRVGTPERDEGFVDTAELGEQRAAHQVRVGVARRVDLAVEQFEPDAGPRARASANARFTRTAGVGRESSSISACIY